MKFLYGCLPMRNELSVIVTPSVWPTIMPSRTLHMRGSPSQPSRFLPLNSGSNPSCAKAAAAKASNSSMRFMALAPFDLDGIDAHFLQRPILAIAGRFGDLLHHVVAIDHFAKNAVFVIEPGRGGHGDEELAAIGVGTRVRHGEIAVLGVLQSVMKFVGEFVARAAAACALGIAALNHEVGDHAMEDGAIVEGLAGLRAIGERDEVLHRFGGLVGEQLDFELPLGSIE